MYFLSLAMCVGIGVIGYYVVEKKLENLRKKIMDSVKQKKYFLHDVQPHSHNRDA